MNCLNINNLICECFCFLCLFLDLLEQELFKIKEKNIEMSIAYDTLFDSVAVIESKCYEWRKKYRNLQKLYNELKKSHSKCRKSFLYR